MDQLQIARTQIEILKTVEVRDIKRILRSWGVVDSKIQNQILRIIRNEPLS